MSLVLFGLFLTACAVYPWLRVVTIICRQIGITRVSAVRTEQDLYSSLRHGLAVVTVAHFCECRSEPKRYVKLYISQRVYNVAYAPKS